LGRRDALRKQSLSPPQCRRFGAAQQPKPNGFQKKLWFSGSAVLRAFPIITMIYLTFVRNGLAEVSASAH
jgi:hypothetical protein